MDPAAADQVMPGNIAVAITNNISVLPFDRSFECGGGESILGAALRQGLFLRYGCRHGGCGTCKARLVDGEVASEGSSFALTASDRAQGWILLCSAKPVTDCTIDVGAMTLSSDEFEGGDQVGEFTTAVQAVEMLTPDTRGVTLRLVQPEAIKFVAGQFVNVEIPGTSDVRSYSIASAPADSARIDLIIKLLPGGAFSAHLESALRAGDRLRLHGPLGQLKVRLSHRRILMVAGGSGLAPFLSMIRDMAHRGNARPVTLVFGGRRGTDLYRLDEIERLARTLPAFEFIPALSEAVSEGWTGETGLVTEVIARRFPTLDGYDAYLAGPPPMIEATVPLLLDRGVRPPNVYFDAFVPTGR
jgi:alkene monooxygenase reductase